MGFDQRLTHTVSIVRQQDSGSLDAHGQPITADDTIATVKAAIQPRSGRGEREAEAISQAGASIAEHTIFMRPTDLHTGDAIVHDNDACPVTRDLPSVRFEVLGVPNAAGLGHHLEVVARLAGGVAEAEGS